MKKTLEVMGSDGRTYLYSNMSVEGRYDTPQNDIQHNETQHNGIWLSILLWFDSECHQWAQYAECICLICLWRGAMTLSITTFSVMTLSIMSPFVTLSIKAQQYWKPSAVMLSFDMLSVTFLLCWMPLGWVS